MLQRAFDRWQREPWISELPDAERVVLLPAEYFYPKLALWNRRDIFVGPCLQNRLEGIPIALEVRYKNFYGCFGTAIVESFERPGKNSCPPV